MARAFVCRISIVVLASSLIASCAGTRIKRLSEEPRTVTVSGSGVFRWSESRGWVKPESGEWGRPDSVRTESFRAFQAGAYADALAGFLELSERASDLRVDQAKALVGSDLNYYVGECFFQLGNYDDALEYYRLVYRTDFPSTYLVDQAQRRVYAIGLAYLHGDIPCEYLGTIRVRCPDHGINIIAGSEEGLILEFPLLPYADEALEEIAKYYFESEEYPEAVPLYDRIAEMEDSHLSDLAEYQAAESTYLQVRGVDYDQRTLQEAERRFTTYLLKDPPGTRAEEARARRDKIHEMESEKNLRIAKFYLRESQPEASELYLDRVIRDFPNTIAAREAREIQKQLDRLKDGV